MSISEEYIIPYRLVSRDAHRITSNAAKSYTRETLRASSNKLGMILPCSKSKDDTMSLTSAESLFNQASGDTTRSVVTNKSGLQSGLCKRRNSHGNSPTTFRGKLNFRKCQAIFPDGDNYAQNTDLFPLFPRIDARKSKTSSTNASTDNTKTKMPYRISTDLKQLKAAQATNLQLNHLIYPKVKPKRG